MDLIFIVPNYVQLYTVRLFMGFYPLCRLYLWIEFMYLPAASTYIAWTPFPATKFKYLRIACAALPSNPVNTAFLCEALI